jgi:hypothetical protein
MVHVEVVATEEVATEELGDRGYVAHDAVCVDDEYAHAQDLGLATAGPLVVGGNR